MVQINTIYNIIAGTDQYVQYIYIWQAYYYVFNAELGAAGDERTKPLCLF